MNKSNFQIVFNMDVSHSYFEGNICKCLQFTPGSSTRALAKRFDLRIRKRVSGFDLYINTRSSLNTFLQYIGTATGQTFFDFDISPTTPDFNFFTDFPANWLGQLVYDSQSVSNIHADDKVQLVPALIPGASAPHIGQIKVRFEDIINQGFTQFTISFTARTTQWQYYIINKGPLQLQNPSISDKTGISFTGPENVTMETGQQALLFTSGEYLLSLSQVPVHKFNLVVNPASQTDQKSSKAKVIFKGLPTPDPIRIGAAMDGNTVRVVSPMYIYI